MKNIDVLNTRKTSLQKKLDLLLREKSMKDIGATIVSGGLKYFVAFVRPTSVA